MSTLGGIMGIISSSAKHLPPDRDWFFLKGCEYVYPPTVFVKLHTLKQQIEKAESEIFEVHQLLGRKNVNLNRVAEEVEDAILVLETMRRNLQENHGVMVNKARTKTFNKLKKRKHFQGE